MSTMRSSWTCRTFLSVVAFPLFLATEIPVLDEFSHRVAENMISCPCSPTARGYSTLHNFTNAVREYNKAILHVKNPFILPVLHKYHSQVIRSFSLCTAQLGYEACVNMDAELRKSQDCAVQVCIFDIQTGKNLERRPMLGGFKFARTCDNDTEFRWTRDRLHLPQFGLVPSTSPPQRDSLSTAKQHNDARDEDEAIERTIPKRVPSTYTGLPTPEHSKTAIEKVDVLIRVSPTTSPSETFKAVVTVTSLRDIPIEESTESFVRGEMSSSSEPVKMKNAHGEVHGRHAAPRIPWPSKIIPSPSQNSIHPQASGYDTRMTEGCVAVEHLKGYVLQHKKDLLRDVLCSRGFCATPHHAIIVEGKMTSMKKLCHEWECIKDRKMVNNLNVFSNRRAKVGEIVVTPYDVRFPRCFVWLIQLFTSVFK